MRHMSTGWRPTGQSHNTFLKKPYEQDLRYGPRVELGYPRVSTAKQDLDRQVDALHQAGVAPERIYLDKKSGATTDRPGLKAALEYARDSDVIVVHTLDRLSRTVRDTLNLIHELAERGVGVRNLADPIKVDSTNPADPMAQLAVLQGQHAEGWRIRVMDPLATDLRAAFPDMRGRSRSNIKYMRQMAGAWTQQARWLSWRRRAR